MVRFSVTFSLMISLLVGCSAVNQHLPSWMPRDPDGVIETIHYEYPVENPSVDQEVPKIDLPKPDLDLKDLPEPSPSTDPNEPPKPKLEPEENPNPPLPKIDLPPPAPESEEFFLQ